MSIKIDLRVPPCRPAPEVADFVKQCEDAGFDGVGILDSQLLERDCFVSMAAAVQATERINVASAVTNPATRHPSVVASAAQTVSELAPGPRARYGLAAVTVPPPPSASRPPPSARCVTPW